MEVNVLILPLYPLKRHDTHCTGGLAKSMASMKEWGGHKTHFVHRVSNPETSSLTIYTTSSLPLRNAQFCVLITANVLIGKVVLFRDCDLHFRLLRKLCKWHDRNWGRKFACSYYYYLFEEKFVQCFGCINFSQRRNDTSCRIIVFRKTLQTRSVPPHIYRVRNLTLPILKVG